MLRDVSSTVSEAIIRARIFLDADCLPVSLSARRLGNVSCTLHCGCWPAGRDDGRGAARMPVIRHSRALNHIFRKMARSTWPNGRNAAFGCAVLFYCRQVNARRSPRAANRTGKIENRDCGRWVDESASHDCGTAPAAALRIASGERTPRRPVQQPGRREQRCRQTASRNIPAISASFRCGANISISRYAYARRNAPLRSPTRVVLASNRCCVSSATRPVSRCGS